MQRFFPCILLILALYSSSCGTRAVQDRPAGPDSVDLAHLNFTVEAAPEWNRLLTRDSGWFGGDGIFFVSCDGRESAGAAADTSALFWFSDTMLGEIENDSLQSGYEMIHNSVATLEGGQPDPQQVHFYWKKGGGKNLSVFEPGTPATQEGDYYWLGDGFINTERQKDLYLFGYRIHNVADTGSFSFREAGNTLIRVPAGSAPPFTQNQQWDIPFFAGLPVDSTGSFGAGLYVNTREAGAADADGYLYIYGVRGKNKALMVARVAPADVEAFDKWRFWDGSGWSQDPRDIVTVTDRVSNELSVTRLADGRYALVFQLDGLGRYVGLRLGKTPWGPFGPPLQIWDCSADLAEGKQFFPYNAKAHPVISRPGELLISYNINSFDFFNEIKTHPHLYRPRFIRLQVQ